VFMEASRNSIKPTTPSETARMIEKIKAVDIPAL